MHWTITNGDPFALGGLGKTKSTVKAGSWSTAKPPSRRSDNRTLFCQIPQEVPFEEPAKRYSWRDTLTVSLVSLMDSRRLYCRTPRHDSVGDFQWNDSDSGPKLRVTGRKSDLEPGSPRNPNRIAQKRGPNVLLQKTPLKPSWIHLNHNVPTSEKLL